MRRGIGVAVSVVQQRGIDHAWNIICSAALQSSMALNGMQRWILAAVGILAPPTLGACHLVLAGAPLSYVLVNTAALVTGLAVGVLCRARLQSSPKTASATYLVIAVLLLWTAFFGVRLDGVARWISLAGLTVQPSLLVLPILVMLCSGRRDWSATSAIVIAAVALALQPDRAMSGALMFALMAIAVYQTTLQSVGRAIIAFLAFGATLLQPDPLQPSPHVEGILNFDADHGLLASFAGWFGALLMLAPVFAASGVRGEYRIPFGAIWLGIIAASIIGPYPTPVVGYSPSAMAGFALSVTLLMCRSGPADPSLRALVVARCVTDATRFNSAASSDESRCNSSPLA